MISELAMSALIWLATFTVLMGVQLNWIHAFSFANIATVFFIAILVARR